MAKIVLQNQTSPTTPDCGFTAMYVNCITGLPTFKRDDGTECAFLLACEGHGIEGMMAECVYDPNCIGSDVFAMDNMQQGTCKQYVTCDEKTCWNNKVDCCDMPDMSEVAKCCDIPDISGLAQCCDIPDISDLAQCCDIPSLEGYAKTCEIPTDVCQLCNSSNYITSTVCDLCNYYLKCETYTKEEVECMVSNFGGFCVVSELPQTGCTNLIYLKGPIGSGSDKYEEYIYNNCWTLIGETSPDLTNYAKCCDIPDISNLAQCCDIPSISNLAQCCDIPDVSNFICSCDLPDTSNFICLCDIPTDNCSFTNGCGYLKSCDITNKADCCDIPDISNLAQCCDIPDISNKADCSSIPTDNCQLTNGCGYTKCKGNMMKCIYDPNNCAVDVYCMENMVDGTTKVAMTTDERTKLSGISGCNTGDETIASIKCKLGISTLSGCNTGDETNSTIKCKLGAASCADDGYLKSCDFTKFTNKQDELISGCNIITINGCTILRCADICICNSGGDMKSCVYDPYGCCTDMFNRANHYGCMSYANVTGLGSSATRDIGTNCGNVVVVQNDGKISSDVLPAQDLVDVCVFNSEAAMLARCDANRGDMAIRTDIARTYVMSGNCPSCIDSWTILPVPSSPVTSVNGCIGDVCLDTDDIDDTNSSKKYVTASEKACWCGKADPYVSGCTIKTINGCSVLGCGNICIPNTITCVNGKTGNVCLTADDISDTGTSHLFVSQCEKNTWNCKIDCADAIVDNCQLCNSCGYITSSDISSLAKCCDIPTNNCQLTNGCGYITSSSLSTYAKCTDLPTNNCQLSNGCGYITSSSLNNLAQCCDVPTDNCQLANTCGYTTCKGTLIPCDLNPYAKCCDIPDVSNFICACDIVNKADCCDIPSIAGLVQECNIACINGCCLTLGGDICIQAGEGAEWAWEDIPAGSCTYTLCNKPVNASGFMVFINSGLGLLPTNDYCYSAYNCTISFCTPLACNETGKIWVMKQGQAGGGGGSGCAEWGYIEGCLCNQGDLRCEIDSKLDKVTNTASYGRVYGIDTAGQQLTFCMSPGLVSNTLVRRSGTQVLVPKDPTCECSAVSKYYVDCQPKPTYGFCDYIHCDETCCILDESQLILEGTLTIDGELINNGKIYII